MSKLQKALFGGALLAGGVAANAQVVFEQTANNTDAFASNQLGAYADFRQADDFVLGSAAQVTGASWIGIEEAFYSADFPPGNIAGFNVQILADDAGLPGAALFDQDFLLGDLDVVNTGAGDPFLTGGVFEVSADFNFAGTPGETYWFSVSSILNVAFEDGWFWVGSNDSASPDWATNPAGAGFAATVGTAPVNGLAFSIEAVPAPGAVGLLGFAGLAAARRRR